VERPEAREIQGEKRATSDAADRIGMSRWRNRFVGAGVLPTFEERTRKRGEMQTWRVRESEEVRRRRDLKSESRSDQIEKA
jgi:hypothetical protein